MRTKSPDRGPPHTRFVGYVDNPALKGAIPYSPFPLSRPSPFQAGILTRISSRWFRHWHTKRLPLPVPYIDHVGKFTIHQLGKWWTYPETWYGSVVSTINQRLINLYKRRGGRINKDSRNLIFRVSAFYAASHSEYAMNRFLALLRPGGLGSLKNVLWYFISRSGDNLRFVFDQACFQASWLSFRSTWIRDKPQELSRLIASCEKVYKRPRDRKFSFVGGNFFLQTLNWLRVWKD